MALGKDSEVDGLFAAFAEFAVEFDSLLQDSDGLLVMAKCVVGADEAGEKPRFCVDVPSSTCCDEGLPISLGGFAVVFESTMEIGEQCLLLKSPSTTEVHGNSQEPPDKLDQLLLGR